MEQLVNSTSTEIDQDIVCKNAKLTIYFRDKKTREKECGQFGGEVCWACYAWINDFYIKNKTLNFDYSSTDLGSKFEDCYDCSPYIEDFYFPIRSKDKISIEILGSGNPSRRTVLICGIELRDVSINGDGQGVTFEKSDILHDASTDTHLYSIQFEVPENIKILDINIGISNAVQGGEYKSINLHIEL